MLKLIERIGTVMMVDGKPIDLGSLQEGDDVPFEIEVLATTTPKELKTQARQKALRTLKDFGASYIRVDDNYERLRNYGHERVVYAYTVYTFNPKT